MSSFLVKRGAGCATWLILLGCSLFHWTTACAQTRCVIANFSEDLVPNENSADPAFVERDSRNLESAMMLQGQLGAFERLSAYQGLSEAIKSFQVALLLESDARYVEAANCLLDLAARTDELEIQQMADRGICRNLAGLKDNEFAFVWFQKNAKPVVSRGTRLPEALRFLSRLAYGKGELELSLEALSLSVRCE